MKFFFIYIFLLLLSSNKSKAAFFGYLIPATTYYVDQLTGNDTNNGTSPITAFQTIAHACSIANVGQSVAVYSGSISIPYRYNEECFVPSDKFSIISYGPIKTLIDGADIISAGSWTKTGGFTNIYQATIVCDNVNGFLRLWENNTYFIRAISQAALDSTPSAYTVSGDPNGGGIVTFTMFVHTSDGSNPATNGKVYEFNKRGLGITGGSFMQSLVSNFHIRRALSFTGDLGLNDDSLSTSLLLEDGTVHFAVIGQGGTIRDVNMLNSYAGTLGKIAVVVNDNIGTKKDFLFDNVNYVETQQAGPGFFGHVNISGQFGIVTLKNCSTIGTNGSISGFNSTGMVVSGGIFDSSITAGSTLNIIKNAAVNGQITIEGAAELDSVNIVGNFVNGALYCTNPIQSLNIHDSTFSNSRAFDGAIYLNTGCSITSFTSQRNIFLAPVQTNHIGGDASTLLPINSTFSTNIYHYPNASSWINFRGTIYDISNNTQWAAWQVIEPTATRVTP